MSSRAKKILIAVIALILLAIAVLIWLSMQEEKPTVTVNTNQPAFVPVQPLNTSRNANPLLDNVAPTPPAEVKVDPRAAIKRIAASFAERYGSYSNQGDFENLTELKAFMTDSYAASVDGEIERMRAARVSGTSYSGVTSRALVSTVEEFDEQAGTAMVRVNAQREWKADGFSRVYYQELTLDFVREGEIWRVDSAKWGEERESGG